VVSREEKLLEAVKQAAVEREGRLILRCADAFAVAQRIKADVASVGRVCNEHRIKIVQCQLGCFR